MRKFEGTIEFIRELYGLKDLIPLHSPVFIGNEKKYLNDCIDSTFVSYVGKYVNKFEEMTAEFLGIEHAVAVVNGTAALQVALIVGGVKKGELVLTQALTFVATANAIAHTGAEPVFIDSEKDHLGMCPEKLSEFLSRDCHIAAGTDNSGTLVHTASGCRIAACVPVHIFGHPSKIDEIVKICDSAHLPVIEDASESIGSTLYGRHMGTFGIMGILSYNGNKTITTGGGGMIVTNDSKLASKAKHITTTAKVPHPYEFYHDEQAFNFRLTNVNAAIGCAQMEQIETYVAIKRKIAGLYEDFFRNTNIKFFMEKPGCRSNYWLNTIFFEDRKERDSFLKYSNDNGVMTRPAWTLMNKLPMYKNCISTDLTQAQKLEDCLVNIPSSVIPGLIKV